MTRFVSFCKQNKSKLWFSALINFIILAILLITCVPVFETSDDTAMRNLTNGFFGERSPHIIFMNYLLGLLFTTLYGLSASIPWYGIVFYIFIFCSLTGVTYVFLNRKCSVFSLSLLSIFLGFFAFEGYIMLQFTRVSSLLTASGMLLILWSIIEQPKNTTWCVIIGILFSITGSLLRFNQALLTIAIMSTIGVFLLLSKKEMAPQVYLRKILLCLLCTLVVLGASYGAKLYDQAQYSGEDWEYYKAFNSARSIVLDFGIPDYEEIEEELTEIGLSELDLLTLQSWTFEDWDVFSLETMQALADLHETTSLSVPALVLWCKKLVAMSWNIPTSYCFFLFFLIWAFVGKHEKRHILTVIYLCVVMIGVYFYLHFFLDRLLKSRVNYGIYFSACLCLLLFIPAEAKPFSNKISVLMAVLCICFSLMIGSHYSYFRLWDSSFYSQEQLDEYEQSVADQDHLYLTTTYTEYKTFKSHSLDTRVFSTSLKPFYGANIHGLGGWTSRLPLRKAQLASYGITNPIRDMVDNEQVYFVGDEFGFLIEFIEAHYGDIEPELAGYIGETPIYRFISQKPVE